jgi:hypothetical protein
MVMKFSIHDFTLAARRGVNLSMGEATEQEGSGASAMLNRMVGRHSK